MGDSFPECLIRILEASGYDNSRSIELIDAENIKYLEVFLHENRFLLQDSIYARKSNEFRFLPGHRAILSNLPEQVKVFNAIKLSQPTESKWNLSEFSLVLRTLIETAQLNSTRNPKQHRYSEVIRNFSIYIYLMCGRSCYETLSANLPIPQACTICKQII